MKFFSLSKMIHATYFEDLKGSQLHVDMNTQKNM